MHKDHNTNQLILFNQPVEVLVEADCSVKRAAELVECSETTIYQKIRQNQSYQRKVPTGTWRVYQPEKKDGLILVNVGFVYSPLEKHWRLAGLS
ncbi:MAG: hypothetical protein VKK42_19290 [Lyngbya sp.]|nr:hypothetical protein [Lyngbya sp.]